MLCPVGLITWCSFVIGAETNGWEVDVPPEFSNISNGTNNEFISGARKIFVYSAVVQFRAPSRIVAEYCGVGLAAVSAMAREGGMIAKVHNFTI